MDKLLEIKNFRLTFNGPKGSVPAVRGVDLSVKPGETLALVGESGCGKTALCRSILRLHSAHAKIEEGSSILLCDNEITLKSDQEMEAIRGKDASMIFQDPMSSLNPVYSIGKQITEAILVHNNKYANKKTVVKKESNNHENFNGKTEKAIAKEQALEILKQVGIDSPETRFNQYPHEFSGGMRQRVAIAIAIACNPKLLIADEPTTSLDTNTQEKIIKLLKEITQASLERGTIFVTHDLGLAEDLADKIAVMKGGIIVEEGLTKEIFENPKHPYTKKLLGYANYGKGTGHRHGAVHYHNGIPHSHFKESDFPKEKKLVEIRNLSKSFELGPHSTNKVLDNFNLDIIEGEILGIVGNSGCGKSTLAGCIMGIKKPDSGIIEFKKQCNCQMIFQDSASAFNSGMLVKDIIAEPLILRNNLFTKRKFKTIGETYGEAYKVIRKKEAEKKVFDVMEQVGLEPELAYRHPYDISGGQRQRAAIARALITSPDFIIADEPISSLDVSIQAQIIHLLKDLHDKHHLTMIVIAHDIPMVAHISDRILEM